MDSKSPPEETPTPSPEGGVEGAPAETPEGAAGVHPRRPTPLEPEAPRRRWAPSNLALRLMTAAVLIPPILWVCYEGGLVFVAVVVAFNCIAVNEFYNFISEKGANPQRLLGTLGVSALPLIIFVGDAFFATSFLTAVLLTTMVLQLTKRDMREAISSVSATFFGVFYVGWLFSHCVSIRFIQDFLVKRYPTQAPALVPEDVGFFFMVLCLAAALGCDAGAFFVGRRFGRHRLAPMISPNKSVEGAIGGIVIGAGFAVAVKLVFDSFVPGELSVHFGLGAAAAFGAALAAVGILGDLVESTLKRDAELKDAGSLLPGVGGVLDRIDSALLAFPVMYYLLLAYYYFRFTA
jgi:phosphatidate cytidylyltransferase